MVVARRAPGRCGRQALPERAQVALSALALLALNACGSSAALPHNPAVELDLVRRGAGNGPSVAVLPRPSGALVRLALWIDAGSRDAQPPQVATLSAWLATEVAGNGVRAHVEPEGTELAVWCAKTQLPRCLDWLSRALATRAPSAARVDAAKTRLIAARRQADAADPGRLGDRLALQALFGEGAAGLLPLGDAHDDGAVSAARVRSFLADHFGPNRALLVAVGDVEERSLLNLAARGFAAAPRARTARVTSREASVRDGVLAGVDAQASMSLALTAPDLASVHAASDALRARLERDGLGAQADTAHALQLRGQTLALLRLRASDPVAAARAVAHQLEQLRDEGLSHVARAPAPEAPSALARRLGARWAAHGSTPSDGGIHAGLGVQVAGGRGDKLAASDPDAELREHTNKELDAAWSQGHALAAPDADTTQHDGTLSATLENHARIELHAQPSERIAVAVRFGVGAAAEPPTLHGRAALLALLATTACAGLEHDELVARLQALEAELEPQVDADGWGLLLTAPTAQWQPALALALDCALSPGLTRKNLSAARLRLLARLGPSGGAGELRAEVAELLSPAAPGQLAPWGHPLRQASVSLADVRELWRASRRGEGLIVGVSGPLPSEQALGWIARRVAPLPAQAPGPSTSAKASEPPRARATERPHDARAELAQPTLGLAVWQVGAEHADAAGAQAFAALARAALAQIPDATASWHDGGALLGAGWAAVAVTAPPERLSAVVAALRTLARALPAERLAHAVDAALALEREQAAERAATAAAQAQALVHAGELDLAPDTTSRARDLARRLAASEPRWVALR